MNSRDEAEETSTPPADPWLVSSAIQKGPPVPLLREDIEVKDRFGSQAVANGLAAVILKVEPPFTISISGTWGVGKTTLAKQLTDRLKEHTPEIERIRCVEIDLWAEDVANLRRLIALKVAVGLQDTKSDKAYDKALKDKADEFDTELRTSQTRQDRPRVTIPRSKRGRFLIPDPPIFRAERLG